MITEIYHSPLSSDWIDLSTQLIITIFFFTHLHQYMPQLSINSSLSSFHRPTLCFTPSPPPSQVTSREIKDQKNLSSSLLNTLMGRSSPFSSTSHYFDEVSKGYNFWICPLIISLPLLWLNTCTSAPRTTSSLHFNTLKNFSIFQFLILINFLKIYTTYHTMILICFVLAFILRDYLKSTRYSLCYLLQNLSLIIFKCFHVLTENSESSNSGFCSSSAKLSGLSNKLLPQYKWLSVKTFSSSLSNVYENGWLFNMPSISIVIIVSSTINYSFSKGRILIIYYVELGQWNLKNKEIFRFLISHYTLRKYQKTMGCLNVCSGIRDQWHKMG